MVGKVPLQLTWPLVREALSSLLEPVQNCCRLPRTCLSLDTHTCAVTPASSVYCTLKLLIQLCFTVSLNKTEAAPVRPIQPLHALPHIVAALAQTLRGFGDD